MYAVLFIIGFVHLLNDSLQAVIPAMFPILEKSMALSYTQLGLIAFSLNVTSSIMQPVVGWYADKKARPYALPLGLCFTFIGMLGLAIAPSFGAILLAAVLIGLGSAVFHPEGSRVVYLAASVNQRGFAQSIFQVGGNAGQSLAPLITALVLVPLGQFGAIWFSLIAALAVGVLYYIARWYAGRLKEQTTIRQNPAGIPASRPIPRQVIIFTMFLLVFLVFSRSWYSAAITNYYAFFLMQEYALSIKAAQVYIFVFLALGAVGTFLGGTLADRFGKRNIIVISMVATVPLALLLPYAGPRLAYLILGVTGLMILSSLSVIVVYAQELLPGKIGTVSGLIIGLSFGLGAIGSVALGWLADQISLSQTMFLASFLPLLGLFTIFLPSDRRLKEWYVSESD